MNCVNWVMSWSIELVGRINVVSEVRRVKYDQSALLWIHLGVVRLGGSWGEGSLIRMG